MKYPFRLGPVGISLLMHLVLVGALGLNMRYAPSQASPVPPIEAVNLDAVVLEAAAEIRRQEDRRRAMAAAEANAEREAQAQAAG